MTMIRKEKINSYENLLKDSYRLEDDYLQEWQITSIDYCLNDIGNNYPDHVVMTRLRYGLDSGEQMTYSSISDNFGVSRAVVRDHVLKVLRLLRNAKYTRILFTEGYLDAHIAIEYKKEAQDKMDQTIGNLLNKYGIFEDVRGYVNYKDGDLELSKYKPTLCMRAVNALERVGISTFRDLLDYQDEFDKLPNIGVGMSKKIKEFRSKLKEFDQEFDLIMMEFHI